MQGKLSTHYAITPPPSFVPPLTPTFCFRSVPQSTAHPSVPPAIVGGSPGSSTLFPPSHSSGSHPAPHPASLLGGGVSWCISSTLACNAFFPPPSRGLSRGKEITLCQAPAGFPTPSRKAAYAWGAKLGHLGLLSLGHEASPPHQASTECQSCARRRVLPGGLFSKKQLGGCTNAEGT